MSALELTDSELVKLVRDGVDDGFEVILQRYESEIYNLALLMSQSEEEAEEVLTEVFVELYREFKGSECVYEDLPTRIYQAAIEVGERRLSQVLEAEGVTVLRWDTEPSDEEILRASLMGTPPEYRTPLAIRLFRPMPLRRLAVAMQTGLEDLRLRLLQARRIARAIFSKFPVALPLRLSGRQLGRARPMSPELR